jgi:hypothetical protein
MKKHAAPPNIQPKLRVCARFLDIRSRRRIHRPAPTARLSFAGEAENIALSEIHGHLQGNRISAKL